MKQKIAYNYGLKNTLRSLINQSLKILIDKKVIPVKKSIVYKYMKLVKF